MNTSTFTRSDLWAWGLTLAALLLILKLHLLVALLCGLLVFELIGVLAPMLPQRQLGNNGSRLLAATLIAVVVISGLVALGFGASAFIRGSGETIPALFKRMAQIIEDSREQLPAWLLAFIPDNADELRKAMVDWLRQHASSLQLAGQTIGRALGHALIGMIIGAMLSLHLSGQVPELRPLSRIIYERAQRLSHSFRRVVFAQVIISSVNTFFTGIYLAVVLPAFGVELPLTKTLIAITFLVGLIPILGNLISNTVIFIVSLSHSLGMAVVSLGYLIVIHKLEYFLNARIIGGRIESHAWELLLAMLIMEAAFGIAGVIAAPIYYAYLKSELREKQLL